MSPLTAPAKVIWPNDTNESLDYSSMNWFWGGGFEETGASDPLCVPDGVYSGGSGA